MNRIFTLLMILSTLVSCSESYRTKIVMPFMQLATNLSPDIVNEEFQSMCMVGTEVWIASGEIDNEEQSEKSFRGTIWRYSKDEWNFLGSITHNLEHMNSMSYDELSDCLLIGESGDHSSHIYIYENIKNWGG